ncbi:hypothetical protein BCR61_08805 [Xanthomonas oryzae pv. oryzae]|nr:hypothetical protein BCR61_08805 [Xanthomonas oryzae pv. oryzae]AZK89329.1 hypothetical protein BO993_23025 [Xanthomonas oryzae pv. oryzae]OLH04436.1 hypothetical protein BXO559_19725 [Xanthomonas oryzae pv. oryzae]OLH04856.1 hypothetical protein BXO589_09000 [Xanthomonas oryzae pv. oryzae]QBA11874.1 hypothetical protein DZA53_17550 [Xanthomonas oryzae pv. oryzae]
MHDGVLTRKKASSALACESASHAAVVQPEACVCAQASAEAADTARREHWAKHSGMAEVSAAAGRRARTVATRPQLIRDWKAAWNRFTIQFEGWIPPL